MNATMENFIFMIVRKRVSFGCVANYDGCSEERKKNRCMNQFYIPDQQENIDVLDAQIYFKNVSTYYF